MLAMQRWDLVVFEFNKLYKLQCRHLFVNVWRFISGTVLKLSGRIVVAKWFVAMLSVQCWDLVTFECSKLYKLYFWYLF